MIALTTSICDHISYNKQALASIGFGCCSWSIQTRIPEDNQLDRCLLVDMPYSSKGKPFMGQYRAGAGKLIRPTGTAVSFRCTHQQLDTMHPAGDRAKKSFDTLTERLVEVLARNKAVESGVIRVARKEDTYRSLDLGVKMDLFVSYQGKSEAYEAKMGCSRPLDVYVLRMYWDGCALDGRPLTQGVLIAGHHSREAAALAARMNSLTDPTGRPYQLCLTTWEDEGIDLGAV